ncbi:hypothetical protein Thermus77420_22810 [Thermus thalpophilus]
MLNVLRILRSYWVGHRDSKALSRKHASLAYLTPNPYPEQLKEGFCRWMEGVGRRYFRKRARLEERLQIVRHQRKSLEKIVGQDEPTPEVFGGFGLRYALLGGVFLGEAFYNKMAMDTLGMNQLEALFIATVATIAIFWMGHAAGNEYRKGNRPLSVLLGLPPLLMVIFFAALRFDWTQRMATLHGSLPPSFYGFLALLGIGLALVGLTFYLGYRSPHEREVLLRKLFLTARKERKLWNRLQALDRNLEKVLEYLLAHYRENVAAYWRGFARSWPQWDPAPEFVGHIPPLNRPTLPPLNLEAPTDPLTQESTHDRLASQPRP